LRWTRSSPKTKINVLRVLQRLVRRRARGQVMLLSPCHCRGRCRIHIRRLLPKTLTKSPITDYEWLIPLIEHLANFAYERYEKTDSLCHPPGYAGELDFPPQLARKPGHELPHRSCRCTRQHPWAAIDISFRTTKTHKPSGDIGNVVIRVDRVRVDEHPRRLVRQGAPPKLISEMRERASNSVIV